MKKHNFINSLANENRISEKVQSKHAKMNINNDSFTVESPLEDRDEQQNATQESMLSDKVKDLDAQKKRYFGGEKVKITQQLEDDRK